MDQAGADRIISLLRDIYNETDADEIINKVAEAFANPINGIQAGAASQILHCLHPYVFPILNSEGQTGYGWLLGHLGTALESGRELTTYAQNTRLIRQKLSERGLTNVNYRSVDLILRHMGIFGLRIWKMSHGNIGVLNAIRDTLESRRVITMSRLTGKARGEEFVNDVRAGDLFYLCYGSQVRLLGRITADEAVPCRDLDGDEWMERPYELICYSLISEPYNGTKKKWSPNYHSTLKMVDSGDFAMFEQEILAPYFDKTLSDLVALKSDCEKANTEGGATMTKNDTIAKNTILYGPPGTGKTYHSAIYAVAICDGKPLSELFEKAKDADGYKEIYSRYEQLISEGRVVFTTFHQSYSYDDFIEGIKPDITAQGEVFYCEKNGVFKDLCEKVITHAPSFEDMWDILVEHAKQNGNKIDIARERVSKKFEMQGDKFYDKSSSGLEGQFVDRDIIEQAYNGTLKENRNSGTSGQKYYSAKAFVEKMKQLFEESEKSAVLKRKLIIIDEINRGNISKIFGELITLIEEDKRGKLSVTLPYSKSSFTVPDNVYVLGTMNTADRSIALMDTALRRRFDFVEMMPDACVLKDGENEITVGRVSVTKLFSAINERVEYLYDREHTIGHAYFVSLLRPENRSVQTLISIFKNKVLPLLQEYFYDDCEKIAMVLGDFKHEHFVRSKPVPAGIAGTDMNIGEKLYVDFDYVNNMTEADFLRIYEID